MVPEWPRSGGRSTPVRGRGTRPRHRRAGTARADAAVGRSEPRPAGVDPPAGTSGWRRRVAAIPDAPGRRRAGRGPRASDRVVTATGRTHRRTGGVGRTARRRPRYGSARLGSTAARVVTGLGTAWRRPASGPAGPPGPARSVGRLATTGTRAGVAGATAATSGALCQLRCPPGGEDHRRPAPRRAVPRRLRHPRGRPPPGGQALHDRWRALDLS